MVRYSAVPPPIVKLADMPLPRRFAHGIRIVGEPIWSGVGTLAVWGPYGYQWLPMALPV